MKVTVVSNNINIKAEFEEKLNASFDLISKDTMLSHISKANTDIVFCVDLKVPVKKLVNLQQKQPELLIVFNAVVVTLEELVKKGLSPDRIIGMNLLPTFINRSLAEITLDKNTPASISTIEELGWEVKKIESRIGLVSPRIIFMIINEAYYTVQEGTASKEDIDVGMQLGTNYPLGPFDWANKIGLINVYDTLKAIYKDTKEGRYKICPLLKSEAQQ